ncbi:MAG: hypothetical protein NVV59_00650 [Chitinophagaceae bacterium]|nr:hypothetical protein [Chitinophagaceae bacterium]
MSILVRGSRVSQPARDYVPGTNPDSFMYFTRLEEILLNDSFYYWYLQTDEAIVRRWNEWRMASAENNRMLEEAVSALHILLNQQDDEGYPRRIHAVYSRLQRARENRPISNAIDGIPENKADIDTSAFDIRLS